jgi:hypothetical protein
MHWLANLFGLTNGSGTPYLFWSGIGSDLGEIGILGGMVAIYRRHACHTPWCLRWGRHPAAGGQFQLCTKHHPDHPRRLTLAHIRRMHHQTSGEQITFR